MYLFNNIKYFKLLLIFKKIAYIYNKPIKSYYSYFLTG